MTFTGYPGFWGILIYLIADSATAALVDSEIYLAGEHYSEWRFIGSLMKCELSHEIPQFGVGQFTRIAGQELTFQVTSFQNIPVEVEALIRELSPSWKHERPDPLTSPVKLKQGLRPVGLKRQKASWLLASLAKGQMPSFDFLDWDDTRKTVHVRLSPVNFQKPYREFKKCLKQISNEGFDDYRNYEVYFELDVHVLNEEQKARLQRLAEYVRADRSITQISIDGHADDQGTHRYNRKLSRRRAESVVRYLIAAGVNTKQLEKHAYGETRPKVRGRSESARALNRRAHIRLAR